MNSILYIKILVKFTFGIFSNKIIRALVNLIITLLK